MSVTDQAFIRAYARLGQGTTPPEPEPPQPSPLVLTPPVSAVAESAELVVPELATPDLAVSELATPESATPGQPDPEPLRQPVEPPRQPPGPQRQRPATEQPTTGHTTYICDRAEACPPAPHVAIFDVIAEDCIAEDCQPLSAFVRLTPARDAFRPAVQVEQFAWPRICDRIAERLRHGLDHAAEELTKAAGEGRRVVAIAGCRRGSGCTVTLLCLARHLATAELPVAMVDADFQRAELAARLGIATPAGWEDVLRDQLPLADAVVSSVQDHVSLLPLRGVPADAEELAGSLPASISLRVLQHHYGIVLVDLGPILDPLVAGPALKLAERSGIDAALLVRDTRVTTDDDLRAATRALAGAGVSTVGIAETFVATATMVPRTDSAHTLSIATRGHAQPAHLAPAPVAPQIDVRHQ